LPSIQDYIARLKKTDMPMVLSVDGKPAVVVFDIRLFEFLSRTGQRELGEILEARIRKIDSGEDEGHSGGAGVPRASRGTGSARFQTRKETVVSFRVVVARMARDEIADALRWISERSPQAALRVARRA
jgi:hypothetical protein